MAYEVKLEVFEGPIDLLLHLVSKQRLDIYEVPLAAITDEYIAAMARMAPLDLEAATGFLVVAATLLELKAARLLPGPAPDEEQALLLEERDRLLVRLVECATFRSAGEWISKYLREGERFHARSAGLEPRFAALAPDLLAHTSLQDVVRAAAAALERGPAPEVDISHLPAAHVSVKAAVADVVTRLAAEGILTFRQLCSGLSERLQVIVRFVALLELFKAGAIELSQAERFGEIQASWTGELDAWDALEGVDEYAVGEGES